MSDWKITKGPVPLDEIEARVIDMRDVRDRGMFPTLVHRERTHYITDVLPSFEGKRRLVTIDSEGRSKLFDVSDPLVFDGKVLRLADEFVEMKWDEYYKNADAWAIEPTEVLYTDIGDIKPLLRADDVRKVVVAGVEKDLKRVSEISAGLLHLVFEYEGETENFYSTKNTRLRVREGKIGTEYLLDHVKRMHV